MLCYPAAISGMWKKSFKDAYCILRSRVSLARRMRLLSALLGTIFAGGKLLGWKVQHFGRDNLRLLYSEIFARQNYRFISDRADPLIIDCGANIGMATLFFKWLYPQARITAFEPDPVTFKALERNVSENNLQNVAVHNAALANEEMQLPFHVPETGSLMMSAVAGRAGGRTITVPAKRLSSFITGDVDLLKLDVEGMEGPILQELAETGKLRFVREAFIEVHHNLDGAPATLGCVLQILENAGFDYHVVDAYSPSSDCSTFQDVLIHARRPLCG